MLCWILYISLLGTMIAQGKAQFTAVGCDTTKGCFLDPPACTGSDDCGFFASWVFDAANNQVRFEISGQASSYIALGFSKSGGMADSDVYACLKTNEVKRSQNAQYWTNMPSTLKGVSSDTVHINTDRIGCEFTRHASLDDNDATFFDLTGDNKYTVIMARSSGALGNGNIIAHLPGDRARGTEPVSFTAFPPSTTTPSPTTMAMTSMDVIMMSTLKETTISATDAATPTQQDITTQTKFTSDGCGITKGCYRSPPQCNGGADCDFYVSWVTDMTNNQVLFTMSATNAQSYVALGFSKSGTMSNSDVYACTKGLEMARSRNTEGNINDPSPRLKGVSDVQITVLDGRIECQFSRQASLDDDNDETFYDLSGNNSYYIILAKSSGSLQNDGNINIHQVREKSGELTSFQELAETTSEIDELALILRKAHGSLMVAAWVFFATLGTTLARFYKKIWPNSKICGKKTWFVLHQFFMMLTFLCCTSAFVIIFIEREAFIEVDYQGDTSSLLRFLHAVFGIIVTALVVLNPIMALCRPKPDSPRRFIFNWAHWFAGTSAHLLAFATICLGLGYRAALPLIVGLPTYVFWIMIIYLAFHLIIWLLLQSHQWMLACQGSASFMEEASGKLVGSRSLTVLFFILLLGSFIATAVIIISIALVGLDAIIV